MRVTRDRGYYPTIYRLEELCTNTICSSPFLSCSILCGILRDDKTEQWKYTPDETELPEELTKMVIIGFQQQGTQLRKNKAGKYPTLLAITRLINYLYAGKNKGSRRASKILLEEMGFPASSKKKERIKTAIRKAGMITIGDYRALNLSRHYSLTPVVVEILDKTRKQPPTTPPQDAPKCV